MALFGKDGERISYAVHRSTSPAAPTLVLQHGFMASWASFEANVEPFTEHFNVLLTELLGHGRSDAPPSLEPYRPAAAIARLAELIETLGVGPVLFCGHSLGGGVGLRLALERPELFAGLIIVNSEAAAGGLGWRERLRPPMEAMAAKVRAEGIDALRDSALFPARGRRLDPASRESLGSDFSNLAPEGIAGTAEALVVDVNCFERLGELRVPTLVVLGDRDARFVESAPGLVGAMPDEFVYTACIEGAAHAANLEQPRLFERLVVRFAVEIGILKGKSSGAPSLRGRAFTTVT